MSGDLAEPKRDEQRESFSPSARELAEKTLFRKNTQSHSDKLHSCSRGSCVKIPAVEADLHVVLTGLPAVAAVLEAINKNVKKCREML